MIDSIHVFDEHNNPILEHVYHGRPPSSSVLLRQYLSHNAPRPPLISLPNIHPTVLVYSIVQDRLLFLCTADSNDDPLTALEFVQKLVDALEEFLGGPLLASKIEANYDVVAQLLNEMCDAGAIATTEPDALRETVDQPSLVTSLLGNLGLPSATPTSMSLNAGPQSSLSTIPWRRSNVRHTSNELYVDIVESLSVIVAPSGRLLSAVAAGTIAFTAKISGVPDLLLSLSAPGGRMTGIGKAMALPTFHPCVRLNKWKARPGDLSFVPPDGRFVLAGYECDLLPDDLFTAEDLLQSTSRVELPVSLQVRTCIGPEGNEFEVLLSVARLTKTPGSGVSSSTFGSRNGTSSPSLSSNPATAGPAASQEAVPVEDITLHIPLPATVRNVPDLRPSRGEAHWLPSESCVEWRVSTRDAALISSSSTPASLRCSVVGLGSTSAAAEEEVVELSYQAEPSEKQPPKERDAKDATSLMPRAASASFTVKGWLPSGLKVDALTVNTRTSKGLGAGVTPYKGVKYHTVSLKGLEVRL